MKTRHDQPRRDKQRQDKKIVGKTGQGKSKQAKKEQDKRRRGQTVTGMTRKEMGRQEFRKFGICAPRCSGNYEDNADKLRHIPRSPRNGRGLGRCNVSAMCAIDRIPRRGGRFLRNFCISTRPASSESRPPVARKNRSSFAVFRRAQFPQRGEGGY